MNGATRRKVAVVTGTRAEWGLLAPVCEAIAAREDLALEIYAGGSHLVPLATTAVDELPQETLREVESWASARGVDLLRFEMQRPGESGRLADAASLGRGVAAIAALLARRAPDVVVVLGDRIEALAAASAASVGGVRVAHIHGGDRAEGVADEAIRHAITKLSHIHLPASAMSAARIVRLGEESARIHIVGSPAIDGLTEIKPAAAARAADAPDLRFVFLMHPVGRDVADEERDARAVLDELGRRGRTLVLLPNLDPGREGILRAIEACDGADARFEVRAHLPRNDFLALVRGPRVAALVGNSSAGLIECAALGVRAVNIGPRQDGRERADNVRDIPVPTREALSEVLDTIEAWRPSGRHPFGEGSPARRIADILATCDLAAHGLSKRNTY